MKQLIFIMLLGVTTANAGEVMSDPGYGDEEGLFIEEQPPITADERNRILDKLIEHNPHLKNQLEGLRSCGTTGCSQLFHRFSTPGSCSGTPLKLEDIPMS